MNIFKYPKRISKESNISFATIWIVTIVCFITDDKPVDWLIPLITTITIASSYCLMVWVVKKIVWDKDINNLTGKP